ncbi:MAG: LytTR family transcriptional regulator [Henriciella sp.]|nr:LytTR family transcriptional regulator [Henriciella sp.]
MRIVTEISRFCGIVVGLGLLFSWLGVYDTGDAPFFRRFVFWTATMAVGAGSSVFVAPFVWSERFEHWPAPFKIAVVAIAVSFPVTVVLFLFNGGPYSVNHVIIQFVYVLIISLIISTGMYVAHIFEEAKASAGESADNPLETFMERLPVKYRTAELHAVASEDHYLRVYTSLGEEMILMRLADAVRELSQADGLQVHRSWWVAKQGVQEEKRVDGRSLLVLPSGIEVPVSRSFRAKAKEAGLIR